MSPKPTLHLLVILLTATLLLTACQGIQTPAPTHDVNLLYTQAAKTIVAGREATQAALPSSTATSLPAATNTPEPTSDVQATATAMAVLQATSTQAAAASPTNTLVPATATVVPVYATITPLQDRAEFAYFSPGRGTSIQKNASWNMTLSIKNAGGKTWNKSYNLAYHTGDQMGSPSDYYLTKDVKPGESYTFVFAMTAPADTGKKQVYWAFRDDNGADMMYIDFDVIVTD